MLCKGSRWWMESPIEGKLVRNVGSQVRNGEDRTDFPGHHGGKRVFPFPLPETPPETNGSPEPPEVVPLGIDRFRTPRTPPAYPWSNPCACRCVSSAGRR